MWSAFWPPQLHTSLHPVPSRPVPSKMDQFTDPDWAGHRFVPSSSATTIFDAVPTCSSADQDTQMSLLNWTDPDTNSAMIAPDSNQFIFAPRPMHQPPCLPAHIYDAEPQACAPPLLTSEPAPPVPPAKSPPSLEQWNQNKSRIKHIYLEEDETLRKVITVMRKEFNFHATENMYKKKLQQWGFVKNIKKRDMRSIVALDKQRREQGKRTQFLISGQPLSFQRIESYRQRNKLDLAAATSGSSRHLPSHVDLRTPPPAASFSPDFYWNPEQLFAATRDSVAAQFSPDCMTIKRMEELRLTGVPPTLAAPAMTCRRMLSSGNFQSAGWILRKLGIGLESSVRNGAPELVQDVLLLTAILGSGWPEATQSLVQQASRLSKEYSRRSSATTQPRPLCDFLAQLQRCDADCLVPTATKALLCFIDTTSSIFGKFSYFAVRSWTSTATYLGSSCSALEYDSLIRTAKHGLRQYEAHFGTCDWRTLDLLDDLGELEYEKACALNTPMDKPRSLFELLLKRADQGTDADQTFWHQFYAQYSLAWIHRRQGANGVAEQYMRDAAETLHSRGVTDVDSFVDSSVILEEWLSESGKHELARKVREIWTAAIPPDEEALPTADQPALVVAHLGGQVEGTKATTAMAENPAANQAAGRAGARRPVSRAQQACIQPLGGHRSSGL